MSYILKQTHYNPISAVFFEEDPENANLLADRLVTHNSIYLKNNVDWMSRQTSYGEEDGVYTRTTTIPFDTIEEAETFFNDIRNSLFWQQHMFPYYRDSGIKSRFEIVDQNDNLVQLLHDNRSITVAGDGPSAWEPYVPV